MLGRIMYAIIWGILNVLRSIGLFRWRVEGLENLPPRESSGAVLAMNHITWLDIPIIGTVLPLRYRLSWLGKIELFKHPVAKWFLGNMNVIAINRGQRDIAAIQNAIDASRKGAYLMIFPEGHRSRTGMLQKGRGGALRIAMNAGVPLIPIAITGTEVGLKRMLFNKEVVVSIGKPYRIERLPDERVPVDEMERMTTEMMQAIRAMLPDWQHGAYSSVKQEQSEQAD